MAALRTGLDRLLEDGPRVAGLAPGARLGVLAHAASVDRRSHHLLERLDESRTYRLERLFSPEHGLWGHEQDMEPVRAAREPWTGLAVHSLYGSDPASLRPAPALLDDLDAVVVDLQDVGSRYYTFVYTLSHVMEAAGAAGVAVIVLDRPNPIGGTTLEGPVLDPDLASFVGRYPLPVRHGLTVGELAGLFRDRFGARCELRVVTLEGWRRAMQFEDTGLPWVAPSPNMPTPDTARVYPGACLLEGTNLSEARGTTQPFELLGAPWLDGRALAERARAAGLAGVDFRAASFRPMFHKFAGRACSGVQVLVRDRERFRPFATYLWLIAEARRLAPGEFAWRTEAYEFASERPAIDYLLGRPGLRERLEAGASVAELEAGWRAGLDEFAAARQPFLLYD